MSSAAALVVGIDQYDRPEIPALPNCVDDAIRATRWLRSIDVAPERIRLHVSPRPDFRIPQLDVEIRNAAYDTVFTSLTELSSIEGDQLFMFLSGHGLWIMKEGSLFLAADYAVGGRTSKNFWIDSYINWFLSWRFRHQFVFYNACKERTGGPTLPPAIKAVGPDLPNARIEVLPENSLTICYAAKDDEKAWAGGSRGVMIPLVLEALDQNSLNALEADHPLQEATLFDWETGSKELDLKTAFDLVIAPYISDEARKGANHVQTPYAERHGLAKFIERSPIRPLPPDPIVPIQVEAQPSSASETIRLVRLFADPPLRRLSVPDGERRLHLPMALELLPLSLDQRRRILRR